MKLLTVLAIAAALAGNAFAADPAPSAPVTAPAPAADATPGQVVRTLYEGYYAALNANDGVENPADVNWMDYADASFTPELSARIKKSQTTGDAGLDVDFLISGQDYQNLKVIAVDTVSSDEKTAVVNAKISNMGTEMTSQVALTKLPEGWRISDITLNAGTPEAYSITQGLKDLGL